MNNRIKQVRNYFHLTQQEFADRIKVKRNTVATYEMGRTKPSDSGVSIICREFNVNEEWLRTGEGEMFMPAPMDELQALVDRYNLSDAAAEFVKTFVELPEDVRQAVLDFVKVSASNMASLSDPEAIYKKEHSVSATRPASYVLNSTAAIGDSEKKVAE